MRGHRGGYESAKVPRSEMKPPPASAITTKHVRNDAKENDMGYPLQNLTEVIEGLQKRVHRTATEKGWHSEPRSIGDEIALMHSELSEALEEFRDGKPVIYYRDSNGNELLPDDVTWKDPSVARVGYDPHTLDPMKTEGIAAEFADVIIRILDTSEERNIPLAAALLHKMQYNATRPYRHGGKAL